MNYYKDKMTNWIPIYPIDSGYLQQKRWLENMMFQTYFTNEMIRAKSMPHIKRTPIKFVLPVVEDDGDDFLEKAAIYIGPKGGKWADPQHTIPYKEPEPKKGIIKWPDVKPILDKMDAVEMATLRMVVGRSGMMQVYPGEKKGEIKRLVNRSTSKITPPKGSVHAIGQVGDIDFKAGINDEVLKVVSSGLRSLYKKGLVNFTHMGGHTDFNMLIPTPEAEAIMKWGDDVIKRRLYVYDKKKIKGGGKFAAAQEKDYQNRIAPLLGKKVKKSEPTFVMPLNKALPVEDKEGVLTPKGMEVAQRYAEGWVKRKYRDVTLEREYPELVGLFYDIRNDVALAEEHAIPIT